MPQSGFEQAREVIDGFVKSQTLDKDVSVAPTLTVVFEDSQKRPLIRFPMNSYVEAAEAMELLNDYLTGKVNSPPQFPISGGMARIYNTDSNKIVAIVVEGESEEDF